MNNRNNKIRLLGERRLSNVRLLGQETVRSSPKLVRSLTERLAAIERSIAYSRVVQPVKQGDFVEAFGAVVRDPGSFEHFAADAPFIFGYRLYSRFRRLAGKVMCGFNAY